jgi:hypothetical protein
MPPSVPPAPAAYLRARQGPRAGPRAVLTGLPATAPTRSQAPSVAGHTSVALTTTVTTAPLSRRPGSTLP